jgi:glycosyltransferase involved in cell wall biosynthesis
MPWEGPSLRVVTLGRLSWQKGLGRLLRALASPTLRALPWQWCAAGEGEDRAALESDARALGLAERVRFVGARSASEAFNGAELCVFPSVREGMPLVPLEASEAGVPVLVSDLPPHRELFEALPRAILPEDEARWPEALHRWFTDPPARLALASAQRALLGDDPRGALWAAYEGLYRALTR